MISLWDPDLVGFVEGRLKSASSASERTVVDRRCRLAGRGAMSKHGGLICSFAPLHKNQHNLPTRVRMGSSGTGKIKVMAVTVLVTCQGTVVFTTAQPLDRHQLLCQHNLRQYYQFITVSASCHHGLSMTAIYDTILPRKVRACGGRHLLRQLRGQGVSSFSLSNPPPC